MVAAILFIEDDFTIGDVVAASLRGEGHEVAWVRTGAEASRVATRGPVDLVILDLGLPDMDGIDLCRFIRKSQPEAVVVMLTARRDEMDVVVGLESGADDYLTKPFGMVELLARVQAHLRRASHAFAQSAAYSCGGLTVDAAMRRCFVGAEEVVLRTKEFDLLLRLASTPGRALSRDTLMSDVWGANWFGSTKTLDVHVAAVRRRLSLAAALQSPPPELPEITTLRGFGYRLDAPSTSS